MCPCPCEEGGKLVVVSSAWDTSNFSSEVGAEVVGDASDNPSSTPEWMNSSNFPGEFRVPVAVRLVPRS